MNSSRLKLDTLLRNSSLSFRQTVFVSQNDSFGHFPACFWPVGQQRSIDLCENALSTSPTLSDFGFFARKYPPFFPSTAFMRPACTMALAKLRRKRIEIL